MQPKTKEKEQREASPADQWDQVAFRLIQQELAPKGYSEIKRGPWRGKVQSNIPFLPKQSVLNCQKISAQMVRTFRAKVLKGLRDRLCNCKDDQQDAIKYRDAAHFWQFRKKRLEQKAYEYYRDQEALLQTVINEIENIGIK